VLLRLRKGQGTLEYVILFAAVIATVIVVANTMQRKIRRSYRTLGTKMENKLNHMDFAD